MSFFRTPFWLTWLYPDFLWSIKTNEPVIYLTFDDGPVPGPTHFVLDTLAEFKAKASFFCVGDNVAKHSSLFQEIIKQGHTCGNHTFNHLNGWKTSTEPYLDNFIKCQQLMPDTKFFRPPYGRIKPSQVREIKKSHKVIMWDVLSQDYRADLDAQTCLQRTIHATRPGSIVVFHDSYKAKKNLYYVLPKYMAHFAEKGFKFLSL